MRSCRPKVKRIRRSSGAQRARLRLLLSLHAKATMGLFSLEHRKFAYWADFAVYGVLMLSMAVGLVWACPTSQAWSVLGSVALGVAVWSPIEYLLHRFVLHGLRPFSLWHAQHHERPTALICSPTLLSTSLIASLFYLPLLWWGNPWWAMGLTLGLLIGYQALCTDPSFLAPWARTVQHRPGAGVEWSLAKLVV